MEVLKSDFNTGLDLLADVLLHPTFPSEALDANGDMLRARGNEFGAVTGRPRRCGWLDLPLLRYAGMINGISWLVVTKLDVLDELAEIPVCVGYKINGKKIEDIAADF